MRNSNNRRGGRERRAVTLIFAAFLMVVMLGMVAFAIDVGYIVLVRTQLQAAADSSAMAASAVMTLPREEMTDTAKQFAGYHMAAGKNVQLLDKDIEYGTWDAGRRSFTPSPTPGNAVRVTAKTRQDHNRGGGIFLCWHFEFIFLQPAGLGRGHGQSPRHRLCRRFIRFDERRHGTVLGDRRGEQHFCPGWLSDGGKRSDAAGL